MKVLVAEVVICPGSGVSVIVSMCLSLLQFLAPLVMVPGPKPQRLWNVTEGILKHWSQIFHPVHNKSTLLPAIFLPLTSCSVLPLNLWAVEHVCTGNERRMLHTYDAYVFNIWACDTHGRLISGNSS